MKASESRNCNTERIIQDWQDDQTEQLLEVPLLEQDDLEVFHVVQKAFPTPNVPAALTASILQKIRHKV